MKIRRIHKIVKVINITFCKSLNIDKNSSLYEKTKEEETILLKGGVTVKYLDKLSRFCEVLGAILFGLMATATFFQVLCRYIFGWPLAWSGELATFLFVWVTMLGAAIATYRISHISITILIKMLPEKISLVLSIIAQILFLTASIIICVTGYTFAIKNLNNISIALRVPLFVPMSSLFFGGTLMVIFGIGAIYRMYMELKGERI